MATPKTRIPKGLRREVRSALECFRDYLLACGNPHGAHAITDVVEALGLEQLPYIADLVDAKYSNPALRRLVQNRRSYGAK